MFNKSTKKTTFSVYDYTIPNIQITSKALSKMKLYTDNCSDEIGWLGTAYKFDNYYLIEDMYLFKQQVHATTTEIGPEGLNLFAEEILQQPDGMDIWNNLKVWGHSHVNMEVNPSGQDDSQMNVFSKIGHDFFFRIITNKKGSFKIDFYNYATGVIYYDIEWEEEQNEEEFQIQKQIDELYAKLDLLSENKITPIKDTIVEEIKEKVTKKYATYNYNGYQKQTFNNKKTEKESQQEWDYGYSYGDDYYYDYASNNYKEQKKNKPPIDYNMSIFDWFVVAEINDLAEATTYLEFCNKVKKYHTTNFAQDELVDFWNEIMILKEENAI